MHDRRRNSLRLWVCGWGEGNIVSIVCTVSNLSISFCLLLRTKLNKWDDSDARSSCCGTRRLSFGVDVMISYRLYREM